MWSIGPRAKISKEMITFWLRLSFDLWKHWVIYELWVRWHLLETWLPVSLDIISPLLSSTVGIFRICIHFPVSSWGHLWQGPHLGSPRVHLLPMAALSPPKVTICSRRTSPFVQRPTVMWNGELEHPLGAERLAWKKAAKARSSFSTDVLNNNEG